MKTLFVLRHAKSSWDFPDLSDFQRPLNDRGRKAAPFMGELMRSRNLVPDLILSSSALRAKQTAMLVREAARFENEIEFTEKIYEASSHKLLYLVNEIDDKYNSAMLVGHNPGFEGIVRILSGEYQRMPTAALAVIDLKIESWSAAEPDCGILRDLFIPKEQMKEFKAGR